MHGNREPLKPLSASLDMAPPSEHNPITEHDVAGHLMDTPALINRKREHPDSVSDDELIEAEIRSDQASLQIIL